MLILKRPPHVLNQVPHHTHYSQRLILDPFHGKELFHPLNHHSKSQINLQSQYSDKDLGRILSGLPITGFRNLNFLIRLDFRNHDFKPITSLIGYDTIKVLSHSDLPNSGPNPPHLPSIYSEVAHVKKKKKLSHGTAMES